MSSVGSFSATSSSVQDTLAGVAVQVPQAVHQVRRTPPSNHHDRDPGLLVVPKGEPPDLVSLPHCLSQGDPSRIRSLATHLDDATPALIRRASFPAVMKAARALGDLRGR